MKKEINLIFPHQLFCDSPLLRNGHEIYLIEEFLFFKQYAFHKQKIAFHRATMKSYQKFLEGKGNKVNYIESLNELSDIRKFDKYIAKSAIASVHIIDPTDDWLEQRIRKSTENCKLLIHPNPQFLNTKENLKHFFKKDKKFFLQTTFYKQERKRWNILLDEEKKPTGGKWTYDIDNRKKYPKDKTPPPVQFPKRSVIWDQAVEYTKKNFPNLPGNLSKEPFYPINFEQANEWFEQFLAHRFYDFGSYEDAIVKEASILNHSLLSPLLNVGLLLPGEIVNRGLAFAARENIPLNSTEGFIRQIIGWREFIRGMYETKGRFSRKRNFWNFDRKIPICFYDGSTGIDPIDHTIKKILKTGYCHHIERLMILGNFMLLCEFDPDEVYRWFMELFIDAYDWVMVPNVYGMCLYADGGLLSTKPYIGGSNYIKKMSDYPNGKWQEYWDGLFWRFIDKHQAFFFSNQRTSMLAYSYKKMSEEKRLQHLENADFFIKNKLGIT
jgi:deoxyribodipyrimidine photolyase-related protein